MCDSTERTEESLIFIQTLAFCSISTTNLTGL